MLSKKLTAYAIVFAMLIALAPLHVFANDESEPSPEQESDEIITIVIPIETPNDVGGSDPDDSNNETNDETNDDDDDEIINIIIPINPENPDAPDNETNDETDVPPEDDNDPSNENPNEPVGDGDPDFPNDETEDDSSNNETEENPDAVINVIMPVSLDFTIDPFELNGRGSVFSDAYMIENIGEGDVIITFTDITVTFANTIDFKPLPNPFGDNMGEPLKAIYMLLDFGRQDTTPVVATSPTSEGPSILLSAHEEGGGLSYCALSISGDVNPYPAKTWSSGDVKITVSYTLEPVQSEEENEEDEDEEDEELDEELDEEDEELEEDTEDEKLDDESPVGDGDPNVPPDNNDDSSNGDPNVPPTGDDAFQIDDSYTPPDDDDPNVPPDNEESDTPVGDDTPDIPPIANDNPESNPAAPPEEEDSTEQPQGEELEPETIPPPNEE